MQLTKLMESCVSTNKINLLKSSYKTLPSTGPQVPYHMLPGLHSCV